MSFRTLVLGGARSGKSARAHSLSSQWPADQKVYIATWRKDLAGDDGEMNERVAKHRQSRGDDWQTQEVGGDLPEKLRTCSHQDQYVLVDCVTMWLSGIFYDKAASASSRCQDLIDVVKDFQGELILVGNEVGSGLVPMDPLSRQFRDANGFLNQGLAAQVDRVEWVVAGIPVVLQG